MSSDTDYGLTAADFEKLEAMARLGARPFARAHPENNAATQRDEEYLDWDAPIDTSHRSGRPANALTLEMCNVIRCAAHAGESYAAIARLFNFVSHREAVSYHARGECHHGAGEIEPVDGNRSPGYNHVTALECRVIREGYRSGRFDTFTEAASAIDCHRSTATAHIRGDCPHRVEEDHG